MLFIYLYGTQNRLKKELQFTNVTTGAIIVHGDLLQTSFVRMLRQI